MKDLHLNERIWNFINNKKGSVTIEFFFMVLLLGILFAFMADLVLLRATQGKLDNASFSLVNILRERTQLYGRKTDITSDDLVQFEKLAKLTLFGDVNSDKKVSVVLEHWWQKGDGSNGIQTVGNKADCPPYQEIAELKDLSPFSESFPTPRKVPLYQVTLCMDAHVSLFKTIVLSDSSKTDLGQIRSSTVAVSR